MNIYVADFKPGEYDYETSVFESTSWWTKYFQNGDIIKAGTILKVNANTKEATFLSIREPSFSAVINFEFEANTISGWKPIPVYREEAYNAIKHGTNVDVSQLWISEETYKDLFNYKSVIEFRSVNGSIIQVKPIYHTELKCYLLLVIDSTVFPSGYIYLRDTMPSPPPRVRAICRGDIDQDSYYYKYLKIQPPKEIDTSKFPAYLIAKEDYIIGDYPKTDEENPNTVHLHFGMDKDINDYWSININSTQEAWYLKGIDTSDSIWDTCKENDIHASSKPWSFVVKGVVSDYITLQWRDCYNEPGSFMLTVPADEENISLFIPDRYVMIGKSDKVMIIETVKINSNLLSDGIILQVSGRSLESILDRRVAFPGMALNTQLYKGDGGLVAALYDLIDAYFINVDTLAQISSDGMKYFYYPDRKIEFLELETNRDSQFKTDFHASINKNVCKDSVLDIINETCQNNDLGYKISICNKIQDKSKPLTWKFSLYTGVDKSYTRKNKSDPLLIFSPILNNVKSCATTFDNTNYKNAIFCGVERDSDGYIDLTQTPSSISQLLGIELPAVISDLRSKIISKLQDNPVTYTGILILAIAGNKNTKSYTNTIKEIKFDPSFPESVVSRTDPYGEGNYPYPTRPITKEEAEKVTVIYYTTFLNGDRHGSGTKEFKVSDIEEFKNSTAYGWFTPTILREATSGANSMQDSWGSVQGIISTITKPMIISWFRTMDSYTKESTLTKWLCQEYTRSNMETGINRREVFVEQNNEEHDDWDAAAINAFRASTTFIKTNDYNDDESDEEVNKKLLDSAKKQAAQYDKTRTVDVDIMPDNYIYKTDYDLGDIVQVDDGYGNMDRYIINSVTISDDTSDGFRIIPEFKRHYRIPLSCTPLEYIRVANMALPVIFSPRENVINYEENMNWQMMQPDIGPDIKYGYNGYVSDMTERRSKWTEFELDGEYSKYSNPEGEPGSLKHNFALLSAIGYATAGYITDAEAEYECLLPYALISSDIIHPLKLGLHGTASLLEDTEYGETRYFYQFMGDYHNGNSTDHETDVRRHFYVPGIGIKWTSPAEDITVSDYLTNGIYRVTDDSSRHIFHLNKAISSTNYPTFEETRKVRYSQSYVDDDTNILAKRPQFQFVYPYKDSKYYQSYEWDYGHPSRIYDYTTNYTAANANPGNGYKNNPWNRLLYSGHSSSSNGRDLTALGDIESSKKYIFLGYGSRSIEDDESRVPYEMWNSGVYGQVNFNISDTDVIQSGTPGFYSQHNNSNYRYIILGGYAYLYTNNVSEIQNIVWDDSVYSDPANGITLYRLKIYEYESSFREYGWSKYKLDDDTQLVSTKLLQYNKSSSTNTYFRDESSTSETVDIATRHLAHDYVPVKYTDVGESRPENNEIYGLYDLIDQVFIPVNYCPNPELFGEDHNSRAIFIEAGGEIARE